MSSPTSLVTVVGGSYQETIHDPSTNRLMGSGLRAASFLGQTCQTFHTSLSQEEVRVAQAAAPHADIVHRQRNDPIVFEYETPVSTPTLRHGSLPEALDPVDQTNVLVFGTVEPSSHISARLAVVDPQHSMSLQEISETVSADRLIISCNHREALRLAGTETLAGAIEKLHAHADGIVVKCGAHGAIAADANGVASSAAHPTLSVHPVGSGDIFSAALAEALAHGETLSNAINWASRHAAGYCGTNQLGRVDVPPVIDQYLPAPTIETVEHRPRVYLASSYATVAQRWLMRQAHAALHDIGASVFNPLTDVGAAETVPEVAHLDSKEIPRCDSMLLLMDGAGSGVSWEGGAAQTQGIPVVAYKSAARRKDLTMIRGHGGVVTNDLASAIYRVAWAAIAHRYR